ncbi:MAG: GNAT family N-acetyltransferase [Pseudomonadota bacterium]
MRHVELEVRRATEADTQDIARVHVTSWRETYAGLVPAEMLAQLDVEKRVQSWRSIFQAKSMSPDAEIFVALMEGELVGFATCGQQRTDWLKNDGFAAEFEAIYVLKGAQRLGVGSCLLKSVANVSKLAGHTSAALWVLTTNLPAIRFYEAMGALPLGSRTDVRGEISLEETAYGWNDITTIA